MHNLASLPLTVRDQDILLALDRCPLTARQLLKLSEAFAYPFPNERKVRARLQVLSRVWVRRWHYATTSRGTLNYYTLSPNGHRLIHDDDVLPRSRRTFAIGISHQAHTRSLADFIVHTAVCAHHSGIALSDFRRENSLRLTAGSDSLYPDCSFTLATHERREFCFYVELDNATERLHSPTSLDSWERKIQLYEAYRDTCATGFRVLVVTTGTSERLENILDAAARLAHDLRRRLFYGITLARYLTSSSALTASCFLDHRRNHVALIPSHSQQSPTAQAAAAIGTARAVW